MFVDCGLDKQITYMIEYEPYKKVYRKLNCGGLAVFDDIYNALSYYKYNVSKYNASNCVLLPVEYEEGIQQMYVKYGDRPDQIKIANGLFIPIGTRYAKWVRITSMEPVAGDLYGLDKKFRG